MRLNIRKSFSKIWSLFQRTLVVLGIIFLIMIVFAFTSGPFWLHYRLGSKNIDFKFIPDYVVFLGGSGMPSESNLMRAYYAAKIGEEYTAIPIIVALPGDTTDSMSTIVRLADELVQRGVKAERIIFESDGINTRSQVLQIAELLPQPIDSLKLVIVTSPDHMRRSMLCFRKAGFNIIGGYPAFEYAIEADLTAKKGELGGNKLVPEVNKSISLRYRFWAYFKLEIIVLREYFALAFYKLKGWI